MTLDINQLTNQAQIDADAIKDAASLEEYRIKYLGRKGVIQEIYSSLSSVPADQKPLVGKQANDLRNRVNQIIEEKKQQVESSGTKTSQRLIDVTLPGLAQPVGHKHLLHQTVDEICSLFEQLGFAVEEGPEVETEFYNFEALNIPADHPSRDGFDTLYLDLADPKDPKKNQLLRSHTSPGQLRILQAYTPPLAVIIPGRVYRPDAVDASHSFMFHQIEGLLVDKDINFAQLKGLLTTFCQRFFGKDIKMRFRPHYFPFTEPSAEVDIFWKGKNRWLEIMGCGVVHPHVFEAAGYPKGKYTGLAFGMGVERIAMLKHGITDIRTFFDNDKRFLEQF